MITCGLSHCSEQMSPPNSDLDQLMADIIDDDDLVSASKVIL